MRSVWEATGQQGNRTGPFVRVASLARPEVDADRAKLRGTRRLRRSAEDVSAPRDGEIHESRCDDRRMQLCLQQSAGDSALPEVDVALRTFGHWFLDKDVTDLEPAAGL